MKRRQFVKDFAKLAALSPILINGMPMRTFGQMRHAKALGGVLGDRTLVLIQLHGGNDGLNTLVPLYQYGLYQSLRPNIAIPDSGSRKYIELDTTMPAADQIGLHPDMFSLKAMYDDAKVAVVQGVGYENTNFSHFRSRDIWFMGGDYDEYKTSGWMGRYLDHVFPNYPDAYPTAQMPDPLGLEIGVKVSLGYYREQGIPTAIATSDPQNFSNIISSLGSPNPASVPDDHYGAELQYIMDIYANANDYAAQLESRFNAGTNNVTYPGGAEMVYPGPAPNQYLRNALGPQLQTIARLIQGGCKTKIYLVRLGGFDTHDSQVAGGNPTRGTHGALLFHLSNAVKAFFDDLAVSGYDENVLAMTFTDFGRRPHSNGSNGTDHGTSSPTFVFGKGVVPGVVGGNPSLTDLDSTGNLLIQHDYRQVIATVLCDWLGADATALQAAEMEDFAAQKLNFVDPTYTSVGPVPRGVQPELRIFPNPVEKGVLNFTYVSGGGGFLQLQVANMAGQTVLQAEMEVLHGKNSLSLGLAGLPGGMYTLTVSGGGGKTAERFLVR